MTRDIKRGLGRGLSALLADVDMGAGETPVPVNATDTLPIEFLFANKDQPRKDFTEAELSELAQSIRANGIIQPLLVRKLADEHYQIVAGERRWRAAQIAQLDRIPVVIREYTDKEVAEFALLENIQRQDLNVIEEAMAYTSLMDSYNYTQETLAKSLGKSRSHVANLMRLLHLPTEVQDMVRQGMLSMGHARALLASDEPATVALHILDRGLSVRETEELIRRQARGHPDPKEKRLAPFRNADIAAIEQQLTASLNLKAKIAHTNSGAGKVTLAYKDLEQLDKLLQMLSQNELGNN